MDSKQIKKIEEGLELNFWSDRGHLVRVQRIRNEGSDRINSYMNASSASRAFFNATSKELIEKYFQEIESVSSCLGNSSYSPKQIILNFMEYIRMSGMYENFPENSEEFPNVTQLSQTGLNIAILGKGVCSSQAEFLNHLLIASDMQSYNYGVMLYDKENGNFSGSHAVVTVEVSDDDNIFLDPTLYDGSIESLEGSFDSADLTEERRNTLSILDATEQEIEEARENAQNYLIRRYGIEEISQQLGLESCSDLEKQIRILTFMEKNLAPTNQELSIRSVVMGSHELEVGKLLELFYKANEIPYEFQPYGDSKSEIMYSTTIDGIEYCIAFENAFDSVDSNLSIDYLYLTIDGEGNLALLSEEKVDEMRPMIHEGRKIADRVKIPQEIIDEQVIFKWKGSKSEEMESEQHIYDYRPPRSFKSFKTEQSAEELSITTETVQDSEQGEDKKISALMELYSDESIDVEGVNRKTREIKRELGREEIIQKQER